MFKKIYKLKTRFEIGVAAMEDLEDEFPKVDIKLEKAGDFNSSYIYQVAFSGDEDYYDDINNLLDEHYIESSLYKEGGLTTVYICPVKLDVEDETYFDEIFTSFWKSLKEKTVNGVEMIDFKYKVTEEWLELSLTAKDTEGQYKADRISAITVDFITNHLLSKRSLSSCLEYHKLILLKLVERSAAYEDVENYVIMPIQALDLLDAVLLIYGENYDDKDLLRIAKEASISDKIRELLRRISVLGRMIEYKGLIDNILARPCNKQ